MTYTRFLTVLVALALAGCIEQAPAPVIVWTDDGPQVLEPVTEETPAVVEEADEPVEETTADAVEAAESAPVVAEGEEQVIGLLLPLGDRRNALLAEALRNAAVLAIEDSGNPLLRLAVYDTVPDPAAAAEAAIDEGAQILVGPLLSGEVRQVKTLADVRGVNVISFSTDVEVAGPGVYIAGSLPQLEVSRVMRYAIARGHQRFAAILPRTQYGQVIYDTLVKVLRESDAELVAQQQYRNTFESARQATEQFAAEYMAINRKDRPTALLMPAAGNSLKAIAAYLVDAEIDETGIQLLGTGLWDSQETLDLESKEGLSVLVGSWFAAPSTRYRGRFDTRFQTRFGYRPPNLAAIVFDATIAATVVAEDDFSNEAITDPTGFRGVTGTFRFSDNGVIERRLAILEVRRSEFRVLEKAETDTLSN